MHRAPHATAIGTRMLVFFKIKYVNITDYISSFTDVILQGASYICTNSLLFLH